MPELCSPMAEMRGPSVPRGDQWIVTIGDAWEELDSPVEEECKISRFAIGEEWKKIGPGGKSSKYLNLIRPDTKRPSPTITKGTGTSSLASVAHPSECRKYSLGEAKRISTFPDYFIFVGTWGDALERIGNSVPPLLMYTIARHIRSEIFMDDPTQKQQRDRRPYKQVLDDLWIAHQAPREPGAPTVVSLFAGAGVSSLGYSAAGFRELLAVEWDAHACVCLRRNFPGLTVYEGDIGKLSGEEALRLSGLEPGQLDVLDGSPPCQGFSTAGKRLMDDPRNQLFREYVRLLGAFQPKVLIMENVSGLVKGKMKLVFAEILRTLRGMGYDTKAWLLNAKNYGIPQSRERMIFVGVREDLLGVEPEVPRGSDRGITFREAVEGTTSKRRPLKDFLSNYTPSTGIRA